MTDESLGYWTLGVGHWTFKEYVSLSPEARIAMVNATKNLVFLSGKHPPLK